jgi:putative selenium metabolism hydrolase
LKLNYEQIEGVARSYKDDVVQFLRELITIPSKSGHEKKVADKIREEMVNLGFDEVHIDDMGNIMGIIGTGKHVILYDSHIDTVGVGDLTKWKVDPYLGEYKNGIIYGRGASDNKAAIATMVYAGKAIKELKLENDFTLFVLGSVQEEDCEGLAIGYVIEHAHTKPDFVVLGECTNLNIYRGHRGRVEIKVTSEGKACHASAPERGENAIYKMGPIIMKIEELNQDLPEDPFLGKGTIAITKIECKTGSLNTIPDECRIYIDRRLTRGESPKDVILKLQKRIGKEVTVDVLKYNTPSYKGRVIEVEKYYPPWVLEESHSLVQAGVKAAEFVLKKTPQIDKWMFSTNGVSTMGRFRIPTIGFGPGEERFSHNVNDQVSEKHLVKAIMFYSIFPTYLLQELNRNTN